MRSMHPVFEQPFQVEHDQLNDHLTLLRLVKSLMIDRLIASQLSCYSNQIN